MSTRRAGVEIVRVMPTASRITLPSSVASSTTSAASPAITNMSAARRSQSTYLCLRPLRVCSRSSKAATSPPTSGAKRVQIRRFSGVIVRLFYVARLTRNSRFFGKDLRLDNLDVRLHFRWVGSLGHKGKSRNGSDFAVSHIEEG